MSGQGWSLWEVEPDLSWTYMAEQRTAIVTALDISCPADEDAAMNLVTGLAQSLVALLAKEATRPQHLNKEVKAQLKAIQKQSSNLLGLHDGLHGMTVDAMLAQPFIGGDLAAPEPRWDATVEKVREGLSQLNSRATIALDHFEARGAPGSVACLSYAHSLCHIWQVFAKPGGGYTYDPVTSEKCKKHTGRFLEFGRACYRPIPRAGNLDDYLRRAYKLRDKRRDKDRG